VSTSANGTRLKLAYIESIDGATQPWLNTFWDTATSSYCTIRGTGTTGIRCVPGRSMLSGESDISGAGIGCNTTATTLVKRTSGTWTGTEFVYDHVPALDPTLGSYVTTAVYRVLPRTGNVYWWVGPNNCVVAPDTVRVAEAVNLTSLAEININHD